MKIFILLLLLGALAAPAGAAPQLATQSRAWAAFSYEEPASTTCYMVAASTNSGARRAFAYITHRPTEQAEFVFKYDAGTALQAGGKAELVIDQQKFDLFSNGTAAWADTTLDKAISRAIQRGKTMRVSATTAAGAAVRDTFSLAGSAVALRAINKMCGIKAQ